MKGKEIVIVNALSKRKWANAMLMVKGQLIDDMKRKYVKDPLFTAFIVIIILHTSIYHNSWCMCKINLVVSFFTMEIIDVYYALCYINIAICILCMKVSIKVISCSILMTTCFWYIWNVWQLKNWQKIVKKIMKQKCNLKP